MKTCKGSLDEANTSAPSSKMGHIELLDSDSDGDVVEVTTKDRKRGGGVVTGNWKNDLPLALKGLKFTYPSGKEGVEFKADNLQHLRPREFLNDDCIDFYSKYIQENLPAEHRRRYHFFNSFLLKQLQDHGDKTRGYKNAHERVKRWTKGVDLFSKDFIFVPVHGSIHWSLVIICYPGNVPLLPGEQSKGGDCSPVMLHLDSLPGGSHKCAEICEVLRHYLKHEWDERANNDQHPGSVPRIWAKSWEEAKNLKTVTAVPTIEWEDLPDISLNGRLPKQPNNFDCGLYVLAYMEFFTAANPKTVCLKGRKTKDVLVGGINEQAASNVTFMQPGWFCSDNTTRLRDHIRWLMCRHLMDGAAFKVDKKQDEALQAVMRDQKQRQEKLEKMPRVKPGIVYLPPVEYLRMRMANPEGFKLREQEQVQTLLQTAIECSDDGLRGLSSNAQAAAAAAAFALAGAELEEGELEATAAAVQALARAVLEAQQRGIVDQDELQEVAYDAAAFSLEGAKLEGGALVAAIAVVGAIVESAVIAQQLGAQSPQP